FVGALSPSTSAVERFESAARKCSSRRPSSTCWPALLTDPGTSSPGWSSQPLPAGMTTWGLAHWSLTSAGCAARSSRLVAHDWQSPCVAWDTGSERTDEEDSAYA